MYQNCIKLYIMYQNCIKLYIMYQNCKKMITNKKRRCEKKHYLSINYTIYIFKIKLQGRIPKCAIPKRQPRFGPRRGGGRPATRVKNRLGGSSAVARMDFRYCTFGKQSHGKIPLGTCCFGKCLWEGT